MPPTMKEKVAAARALLVEANKQTQGTEEYNAAERKLEAALHALGTLEQTPLNVRIEMFTSGAVDLCMELARTEGKHLDDTLDTAWGVLEGAMCVMNGNDKRENESVRMGVDKGLIELAAWEISKEPLRKGGRLADRAFLALTSTAGKEEFASRVLQAGTLEICLTLVRRGRMDTGTNISVLDSAITTLSGLARSRPDVLRATPGIVESLIPLLSMLERRDNDTLMMVGFKSARTIIRLVGKDDTSRVIRDNGVILDSYTDVISKAMASGPDNGFSAYKGNWSLSGLALDLSLISLSDTNKPLLARFVPHILDMLVLYGKDDTDLIHHGLVFLSQITFDEQCMIRLNEGKAKVDKIRTILRSVKTLDAEITSLLTVVVNAVFPPAPAPARRSSVLQRVASVVKGTTTTKNKPQVMISYHQQSTGAHAQALVKMLENNGYRTWIDTRDMHGDVQEAMSMAVQSSDVVMVLVSVGYKESANCRLECQYAFKRDVPVLFVVCEETYKNPDGWLGLLMGQTMWVGIFTVAMVDVKAAEVVRRVKEVIDGVETLTVQQQHRGTDVSAALDEMREAMKAQAAEMAQLKAHASKADERINRLEAALKALGGTLE